MHTNQHHKAPAPQAPHKPPAPPKRPAHSARQRRTRLLLLVAGAIVGVAVLALIAVNLLISADWVRDRVASRIKKQTGQLKLWPALAVAYPGLAAFLARHPTLGRFINRGIRGLGALASRIVTRTLTRRAG